MMIFGEKNTNVDMIRFVNNITSFSQDEKDTILKRKQYKKKNSEAINLLERVKTLDKK